MKNTNENIENKNTEFKKIDFLSKEEAQDFKQIALGRKFCKKGEKIKDIYEQELERYKYENELSFLAKIFKKHKYTKLEQKHMIENKRTRTIRNIIFVLLRKEETIEKEKIINQVKQIILDNVEKYEKNS